MREQSVTDFLEKLKRDLRIPYSKENVVGDHTHLHTGRMVKMGPRIFGIEGFGGRRLNFDLHEYEAAVQLHNLDRSHFFEEKIKGVGLANLCRQLLGSGPFDEAARERIVDAATRHSKKDDEPGDSDLLQAVRIADKVDRFAPNVLVGCGTSCPTLLAYDDSPNPFWCGGTTRENEVKTQYKMFFRVAEWYAMLPSDEARALVNPRFLKLFIEFLRCFGEEISGYVGVPNRAEEDIRMALGPYYQKVLAIVGRPES